MTQTFDHPQNPYRSFVVRASAGSGKTYQLSRRFLALVAAGADPGRILTVSFTRKAATEMAQRILADAAAILRSPSEHQELSDWISHWHQMASAHHSLPAPQSLKLAAEKIIANSGRLQISTIDSLLYAWLCQYPRENQQPETQTQAAAAPSLTSSAEVQKLKNLAWNRFVFRSFSQQPQFDCHQQFFRRFGIHDLKRLVFELCGYDSLLWTNQQNHDETLISWSSIRTQNAFRLDEAEFFARLRAALSEILNAVNAEQRGLVSAALSSQDWQQLMSCKLISKTQLSVSGTYLKGKKREALQPQVEAVEDLLRSRVNQERFDALDHISSFVLQTYHAFIEDYNALKSQSNQIEFSDLIKCGYDLVVKPENFAARLLIQNGFDHLMLDEFQDTSQVQWRIFDELISETISGQRALSNAQHLAGTVFIVGDEKQSIYGFRDADPSVMEDASERIQQAGGSVIQLNANFRSAAPILDLVNRVFLPLQAHFPIHSAAKDPVTHQAHIPPSARLGCIYPNADEQLPLTTQELRRKWLSSTIADRIAQMLDPQSPFMIYDHRLKTMRAVQPSDIAILYRASTGTAVIAQKLKERGIPVHQEESADFLSYQDICDALSLIRLTALPHDLLCLSEVLRSPWIGLSDSEFMQWAKNRGSDDAWAALEKDFPGAHQRLCELVLFFKSQCASAALIGALESAHFVESIRNEAGNDVAEEVQRRLCTLIEVVRSLEANGHSTAWEILRAIDDMAEGDQTPKVAAASHAVRMMTIHKSKGLEFPVVFLIGSEDPWDKADIHWHRVKPKSRLATLFYVGNQEDQPLQDDYFEAIRRMMQASLEEEAGRLLYVALTRARFSLIAVSTIAPQSLTQIDGKASFFDQLCARLNEMSEENIDDAENLRSPSSLEINYTALFINQQTTASAEAQLKSDPKVQAQRTSQAQDYFGVKTLRPSMASEGEYLVTLRTKPDHRPEQLNPAVAIDGRLTGIFLHRCIQLFLNGTKFDVARIWQDVFDRKADQTDPEYAFALSNWQSIQSNAIWTDIRKGASRLRTEVPILMRRDDELLRGSIDLLVEYEAQTVKIFDHKLSDGHDEELLSLYGGQLHSYHQAVSALFPNTKVSAEMIQLPSCRRISVV